MGYRVKYIYIYPFTRQLILDSLSIIFDYIYIVCIYTLIITLIIHAIDFNHVKSNLHCCILAQISVLIPILVCMGLGFLA